MLSQSLSDEDLIYHNKVLNSILNIAKDNIVIFDNEGIIKHINPAALKLFQYSLSEIIGKKIDILMPQKYIKPDKEEHVDKYDKNFKEALGASGFTKGLKKNGESISLKINVSDLELKEDLCFVATIEDCDKHTKKENTTEVISHVQSMYINKIPLPEIFKTILDFMMNVTESKYGFIGPIYEDSKGKFLKTYAISNIDTTKQSNLHFEDSSEHGLILRNIDTLFDHLLSNKEHLLIDSTLNSSDIYKPLKNDLTFDRYLALPIKNSNNLTIGMFYLSNKENNYSYDIINDLLALIRVIASIMESSRNTSMIESIANIDPLSKAYNRNYLNKYLAEKVNNLSINNTAPDFAVIMIDCNDFKKINDFYGHDYGDHVLIQLVKRIKRLIKDTDIIARLGGDEFIIVANNIQKDTSLESIAIRISNICNQNYMFKGKSFHSSISIGITSYYTGMKINTLLKQADLALYKSKSSNSDYSFFSEDLEKVFTAEQELERYITNAFNKNWFFFHYQPQIDLATHSINGFEALLRFNTPDNINVNTQQLVNHIRKIGLSERLNLYAVRKVIEDLKNNDLQGRRVSINISPYVKDFLEHMIEIVNIIDNCSLPNNMFELELVENAFGRIMCLKKNDHISELLKEKTISLAIDDFGIEYSSINRLIDHHVDALKIDQTFIRTLQDDDRKQIIVKAIIGIAKSLGIKSVAEGVEHQVHEDLLKDLGCDYAQGYLYAKPLTLDEAVKLIDKPLNSRRP